MLLEGRGQGDFIRSNVEANEFHIPSLNSATGGAQGWRREGEAGWRIVSHLKERGRGDGRVGKGGTPEKGGGKGPPDSKTSAPAPRPRWPVSLLRLHGGVPS